MSRTISGNNTSGITLASGNNPVTVTGDINVTTGVALTGPGGQDWTITNSGLIKTSAGGVGVRILSDAGSVTNNAGGVISTTGYDSVALYGAPGTIVNGGLIFAHNPGKNSNGYMEGNAVDLYDGGKVINLATGTIAGTRSGVDLQGYSRTPGVYNPGNVTYATTLDNAGTIIGSGLGGAVNFYDYAVNNRLIDHPGAVFRGGTYSGTYRDVTGSGDTLELASGSGTGTVSGLGTNFTGFHTLQFDSGAKWIVSGAAAGLSAVTITGFAPIDTIGLTGFVETKDSFSNNTLVLTNSSNGTVSLHVDASATVGEFGISTSGGDTFITGVPCFLPGTHILTDKGEVLVEKLQVGDSIVTISGGRRRLCWIGQGHALATRGRRSAATPLIVRKGALADNVPHCDLHITKGHALYLDGVLIPVEFLVNHRSILWDDRAQEVTVYHLELDVHDVLIADGAPAESYRDDGNRWLFQNANSGWDQPAKAPCAPVLTGGDVVDAVWQRLLDRTGPRPHIPLTDEPDLHLLVDGRRLDAMHRDDGTYVFSLCAPPDDVRIASRSVVPQELGLARDARSLGVALRKIIVRQGTKFRIAKANDARLACGFHYFEEANDFVWTDGDASSPAELLAGFSGALEIVSVVAGTTRYVDDGEKRSAA
jgi:hypothetical protein